MEAGRGYPPPHHAQSPWSDNVLNPSTMVPPKRWDTEAHMFPTADSDYQTQHQEGGWEWTTPWSSREAAIHAPSPLRAGIPALGYLMTITPSYVLDQVSLQIHTGLPSHPWALDSLPVSLYRTKPDTEDGWPQSQPS